jgi:hypothetical protein
VGGRPRASPSLLVGRRLARLQRLVGEVETQDLYKTDRDRQREEHEPRRRHRAERKRLQESALLARRSSAGAGPSERR